jgi:hypothetical protein
MSMPTVYSVTLAKCYTLSDGALQFFSLVPASVPPFTQASQPVKLKLVAQIKHAIKGRNENTGTTGFDSFSTVIMRYLTKSQ